MHSRAKNYLIILLAFATATAGTLAWRQTQRLSILQESLLAANTAAANTRKAAASKPAASTATTVAEAAKPADDAAADPADAVTPPARPQRNNRPNLTTLMANPEFAKAWNTERRAQLDNRYAGLFKDLNLSPSQLENLKNLLVERESAAMDVYAAARDKGLNPLTSREEINKRFADAQADADQSIKAALGDAD